ncbi:MAG: HAD-IIA family hydrolase [Anaerolineaceae bacterium]
MLTNHYPQIRGLILDMDGVLWHDDEPIGDLPEIFSAIDRMALKVTFATNNATKSVSEFLHKLADFGVKVHPEQIVTAADAALRYISEHFAPSTQIFVIGSESLREEVRKHGFLVTDEQDSTGADVVLVALDTHINYQKLARAGLLIRAGAKFIATNTDATYPTPKGLLPGAGTLVAAVAAASGKEPLVIGKPQPTLFQQAMEIMGTQPRETLCVGDRLETDILGGQNAGCLTALVLGGVSTLEQAQAWQPQPTIIARDLKSLVYD